MIILHPYYFTLIIFIRDIYLSPCDANDNHYQKSLTHGKQGNVDEGDLLNEQGDHHERTGASEGRHYYLPSLSSLRRGQMF
jgi:hypothetical protein